MRVFRIAAAQFIRSRKEAFNGQGGLQASARWHTAGRAVVYAAQCLSLAALEILVRLKQTIGSSAVSLFRAADPGGVHPHAGVLSGSMAE